MPGLPHEPQFAAACARFREVRARSEALCRPLAIDDYQVQSVPETSPPKWHLAHVTWFFETFLLKPFLPRYRPLDERYGTIFNSYYNALGGFHPRAERHTLSRPTVEEVYAYRAHVDRFVSALLATPPADSAAEILARLTLGLHHEQQHQELLLMDVKRNFFANPLHPAYSPGSPEPRAGTPQHGSTVRDDGAWLSFSGGLVEIGHTGSGFSFDNERPRHAVFLRPYRLAGATVTNAEYRQFIEDGGYRRADLWLSDGWNAVHDRKWQAPLYWKRVDGEWHEMTLGGLRALRPEEPVCHVSYYEADAYARWRDARLPTEAEWEAAAAGRDIDGNFVESGAFHPRPHTPSDDRWFGDTWIWTSSAYSPYPGFRPLGGALGEYNGKFMANQYVLRGGSCATPQSHMRATYRNFFYPQERWAFTGIRLAADA